MYIGSYTDFDSLAHLPANKCVGDGVYCLQFNNGNIIPKHVIKCYNPAVLVFHPNSNDIIYALTEGIVDDGIINAYNIDRSNNKIKQYGKWSTKGKSLCYFKVDPVLNKYGIAINYWEGSLDLFELNKSGKIVKHLKHINHNNLSLYNKNVRRQVKNREDHWEHRQCGSHAHSIHYYGNNVFIPDLGENAIFQYKFNPYASDIQNILVYQTQLKLKHGCGPRHMVFNPKLNTAYVSNELNSSIVVLKIAEGYDIKHTIVYIFFLFIYSFIYYILLHCGPVNSLLWLYNIEMMRHKKLIPIPHSLTKQKTWIIQLNPEIMIVNVI